MLGLAACADSGDEGSVEAAPTPTGERVLSIDGECTPTTQLPGGLVESGPRDDILPFPWEYSADEVRTFEDFNERDIVSGGPPPDGIAPIEVEMACFDTVEVADADLTDDAPVLVVEVNGDLRAYPLGIMTQHEIANDVIGGVPVVVTYCPLCNSGLAFSRSVGGEVLTFGTSGRLFQSNLVMYDRQHHNLWSQFNGLAVVGSVDNDLTGTVLERIPTSLLGWSEFKALAPDGLVLSQDVDATRDYNRNPYPGYDEIGIGFGLFKGETDDRLPANTRVVGLGVDDAPIAIPLERLMNDRVVVVDLGGTPVSVWWSPGASSALDSRAVDGGRDVGQTASVVALAPDGTDLTFRQDPERPSTFLDDQTGSRWDLLGRAIEGELEGTQLEVVPRDDTFWFVWFAFQPETVVAGGAA